MNNDQIKRAKELCEINGLNDAQCREGVGYLPLAIAKIERLKRTIVHLHKLLPILTCGKEDQMADALDKWQLLLEESK